MRKLDIIEKWVTLKNLEKKTASKRFGNIILRLNLHENTILQ